MHLSERRAYAVAQYLVNRHGLDPQRIYPVGKGETAPYDHANPAGHLNRRVEFWNIGG